MNSSRTPARARTSARRQSRPAALHPLGSLLLAKVEALVLLAHHGQLDAPADVLAVFAALASIHLDGAAKERADEVSAWYAEESLHPDTFTGRFATTRRRVTA